MILPASPSPPRNSAYPSDDLIVWDSAKADTTPYDNAFNQRRYSREAILFKSQYFALEEMLLQSFEFAAPDSANANVFSIKFATIIKDACNVFEIVCRGLYEKFYVVTSTNRLNIFNFLSLHQHLDLASKRLILVSTFDQFSTHSEVTQPFISVAALAPQYSDHAHVPNWWKAYNSVKHSNQDIATSATLAKALASVSALFILLHRIYGPGLVYGMSSPPNQADTYLPNARSSLLFSPAI